MLKRLISCALAALTLATPVAAEAQSAAAGAAAFNALRGIQRPISLEERCAREGSPLATAGSTLSVSVPTGTSNTALTATTLAGGVGYALYVDSLWVSAYPTGASPGTVRAQVTSSSDGSGFPTWVTNLVIPPTGMNSTIAVKQVFRRPATQTDLPAFAFNARESNAAGAVAYAAGVSVTGCQLTNDLNWSAPRIALQVGDSTCAGTGPTKAEAAWYFAEKEYVRPTRDIRLILKCRSGSSSVDHETYRKLGYYDVGPGVALVNWVLGINDAAQSIAPATYTANAAAFWTYAHALWPTAHVFFYGPSPLGNATYEANAAGLRTALQAWVAGVNDPRIHYCNLGSAWTPTDATKTTDTTHPNDAGHAALYATAKACLDAAGGPSVIQ